ncbi:MAG: 50S ribosomal protein L6 [Candidatus Omnitrophota bacterium]
MSRKAKIPIELPKEVKVNVDGSQVKMEGPKGKMNLQVPSGIAVELKENKLAVNRLSNAKQHRANHGTIRAHLANMLTGLTQGHKKELEIQGIGFRAQLQGKKIVFILGFSHPVEFNIPDDVKVTVPTQTSIIIEGISAQRVGQVAASIRDLKKVEPYKGKGIRYLGENVRRKQGKSVSK